MQLGDGGRVGENSNPVPVPGLGRHKTARDGGFARDTTILGLAACHRYALSVGSPHQDAAVTIDNNLFPILDLERAGAKANDHRKAE